MIVNAFIGGLALQDRYTDLTVNQTWRRQCFARLLVLLLLFCAIPDGIWHATQRTHKNTHKPALKAARTLLKPYTPVSLSSSLMARTADMVHE